MTATPRSFPLGSILSVVTGRLVSRDHIGGVYEVCDFMSGEQTFTHALPRVSDEATPEILRQHPALAAVVVPDFTGGASEVFAWLAEQEEVFGTHLALTPMAPVDHTSIDPVSELRMMRPDAPIIVVDGSGS